MNGYNVEKIRADFPILKRVLNNRQLIYLDNTATTQKPNAVICALNEYYTNFNANIHRAVHTLGEEATERYEAARVKVAGFIGADPDEIVFTRNTTEGLNLVAASLGSSLDRGDEVITTIMEHHSNIVPWQMFEQRGIIVKYADINDDGTLNVEQYSELVSRRTKIITLTHVSNILGTINPVKKIAEIAHDAGAYFVVDGAQSVPHMPINVKDIGADFLAFSGHKMLAPMGIGVLYGKRHFLDSMPPFLRGGDMIKEVYTTHSTFNDVPHKFEAGTPNAADAIALGAAVDYLRKLGMDNVRKHEKDLTSYAMEKLQNMEGIKIYGPPAEQRTGVLSFNLGDAHSHDVASLLDEEGVAVRSGHGCAMPLIHRLGTNSVCRASFYVYNTKDEIDALIDALEKAKKTLKIK